MKRAQELDISSKEGTKGRVKEPPGVEAWQRTVPIREKGRLVRKPRDPTIKKNAPENQRANRQRNPREEKRWQ